VDRARHWLLAAGLAAWLVVGVTLGAILLLRHMVPLPTPAHTDTVLRDAIRADLPRAAWRAVHVMYRDCACSRRTIEHLLASPRPPQLAELVVMVDDDGKPGTDDAKLRAAGFPVQVITPDQLRGRYHLEAAPVLVVMGPDGELAYVGGYNRHKQSAAYEDVAIIDELRTGSSVSTLPVFGCATSARLANMVDPLHLARTR
jgi:hypothetical protein